jgi:hypothetical protein
MDMPANKRRCRNERHEKEMEVADTMATTEEDAMGVGILHPCFAMKRERYGQLQLIITTRRRQDTSPAALVWCVDTSFSNMQGSPPMTSKD